MELYMESEQRFVSTRPVSLRLEHSLVSVSKWEMKWRKPFLVKDPPKTREETIDYIRCMTINQNVDPLVYYAITNKEMAEIQTYIDTQFTATTFDRSKNGSRANRQIVTSELIYYWMVAYQIPFECQKWHLSRLMTLIEICNVKNQPSKKMSRQEILSQNKALNAARRAKMNTKG